MSKNPEGMSPLELMKAAGKPSDAEDVVVNEEKTSPETDSPETINQVGPAYRLPSAPCSIIYRGERHVYPDGIVRPMTKEFAEMMQSLAKTGGAVEIKE